MIYAAAGTAAVEICSVSIITDRCVSKQQTWIIETRYAHGIQFLNPEIRAENVHAHNPARFVSLFPIATLRRFDMDLSCIYACNTRVECRISGTSIRRLCFARAEGSADPVELL
jgi:hypothetical protein